MVIGRWQSMCFRVRKIWVQVLALSLTKYAAIGFSLLGHKWEQFLPYGVRPEWGNVYGVFYLRVGRSSITLILFPFHLREDLTDAFPEMTFSFLIPFLIGSFFVRSSDKEERAPSPSSPLSELWPQPFKVGILIMRNHERGMLLSPYLTLSLPISILLDIIYGTNKYLFIGCDLFVHVTRFFSPSTHSPYTITHTGHSSHPLNWTFTSFTISKSKTLVPLPWDRGHRAYYGPQVLIVTRSYQSFIGGNAVIWLLQWVSWEREEEKRGRCQGEAGLRAKDT